MGTLNLKQGAKFLHMHWQTLRVKTKAGEIPGGKIAKEWVFIEEDLVSHIRSKYASTRSRSQVQHTGDSLCYTNDQTQISIGADLPHQTELEYKNLLKR